MSTPGGSFRTAPSFRQTSSAKAPPLVTAHTCSMPDLIVSQAGAAAFAGHMMKKALRIRCKAHRRLVMAHMERTYMVTLRDRLYFGAHFSDDA